MTKPSLQYSLARIPGTKELFMYVYYLGNHVATYDISNATGTEIVQLRNSIAAKVRSTLVNREVRNG